MSIRLSTRLLTFVTLACLALAPRAFAGTISLAWDPVDHADLAGYRVYYDTTQNAFGDSADAGSATQVTLSGLTDCEDYYVAVKAYDSAGVESEQFSNSVIGWARPTVSGVSPSQVERGSNAQLIIDGTNYQPGAVVTFTDQALVVTRVTRNDCRQLAVDVEVGASAGIGGIEVRVVNPDQVYGAGVGLFAVTADATGPSISTLTASSVGSTDAGITWQTDEPADSRVFFRLQGEVTYQPTPLDADLVTDHQVQLEGLQPESTYEYYAQSTDSDGNSTVSGAPLTFTTQSSPYLYLRIEAEDGQISAPLATATGAGAFENVWLEVPVGESSGTADDPTGRTDISFHAPHAATWRFWVRTYGPTLQNDSWFEGVDGAALQAFFPAGAGEWHWVEVRSYDLSVGLHTLTLGGREAEARVDRVLITDDPTFVATEQPRDDTTPPDPVSGLTASSGDGVNSLVWSNPTGESSPRVVVRYRSDGQAPLNPDDGLPLFDEQVVAGGVSGLDHTGLANGTTYSYSVFVLDPVGNVSAAVTVHATPSLDPPASVENLVRTDTL